MAYSNVFGGAHNIIYIDIAVFISSPDALDGN